VPESGEIQLKNFYPCLIRRAGIQKKACNMKNQKVAVVDVRLYTQGSLLEQKEFIHILGKSIQEFGFVVVEGHGVETSLIEQAYHQMQQFFSLPLETKLKYSGAANQGQRGYTNFGVEHAKNSSAGDLKEFWHVGRELFSDQNKKNDYEKNIWPELDPAIKSRDDKRDSRDDKRNFDDDFKKIFVELYSKLDQFASVLLCSLAEYLNLPKQTLSDMAKDGNTILRALHYPPLTDEHFQSGAVRSAEHEDINLITILCEATQSGLQLLNRQNQWIDIECKPGQMVVDSGDMLSRITNNVIPSTTHRVINPIGSKNHARYSMPFFVHPWKSCPLEVFENCASPSMPIKYPPIFAGEFLLQRLKEIGLVK
jgi:isopenicillin N synthase-like dioxygenase